VSQVYRAAFLAIMAALGSTRDTSAFTQDIDQVLERANKLLEESKATYEAAKAESSVQKFVEAGFQLEEARAKYLAVQEFAQGEKLKVAQEQLKIVGQLAKLIHDGKVAIADRAKTEPAPKDPGSSTPDRPATPAPAPVPPPVAAAPEPAASSASPQRLPMPDPAKIRDAEKTVRDLFKSDYAKKQASDRQALAKRLLKEGLEVVGEPAAQWALLHEAQDLASQIVDTQTAFEAVQALGSKFQCDALGMKTGVLVASAKSARTPEELARVAEQYLKLSEESLTGDNYDLAEKAVQAANPLAKRSGYAAVITRCASRPKEIAEAKARYEKIRKAYDTLARDISDPGANLEIGLYLCFTKTEWDAGLVFLMKGSDAALASVSGKELLRPSDGARQMEVADAWWDLGEKEKIEARKHRMVQRAAQWYLAALPSASGLVKAKALARLESVQKRAAMRGLEVLLGSKPEPSGIVLVDCEDGLYEAGAVAGKAGVKMLRFPANGARYLYFHLTEHWPESWRPVEVDIEYFDDGGGSFDLEYDSTSGPWANTGKTFAVGSSKGWKVATFSLPDPAFRGRLNSGDLRLRQGAGGDLWIHRVVVRLAAK
jgi:hypothetical protein